MIDNIFKNHVELADACGKTVCFVHDATNCIIKKSDVSMTMGAERNRNASNNNPLIVYVHKKK